MKTFRCAIYTRKSSEEGLDQEFNSLDAQRESCEAYIKSQAHEGWKLVRKHYDDGGYSGGNIVRPGLQRLLVDIREGHVDVVVVYKVDRLTRSLSDFAKIVDTFDEAGASFVAVTQHFNTTTSMGRLTLNVLLSFAQFEREVTGERIRDKIAASKRKGMWMGGPPPLGYDLKDRKLHVNEQEGETVRLIYELYLELGNVALIRDELRRRNIKSKAWISQKGKCHGGNPFARGALHRILRNRLYLGEIEHRGEVHQGEHEAIVPIELWEQAQEALDGRCRRNGSRSAGKTTSLLEGIVFDDAGNAMLETYAQKTKTKRYRYYVSAPHLGHSKKPVGSVSRLPAAMLDEIVVDRVKVLLDLGADDELSRDRIAEVLECVTVREHGLELDIRKDVTDVDIGRIQGDSDSVNREGDRITVHIRAILKRSGGEKVIVGADGKSVLSIAQPDPVLVKNVAQAFSWREAIESGEYASIHAVALSEKCDERYVRKLLRLAYLAPDIVESILDGRQPRAVRLAELTHHKLPISWKEQRIHLGFAS